jgi:ferredoxin-NADP reductase
LKEDLKEGDEIAVQLGPQTLHYRGQYLPVTDMVYMASGPGIVPIVEQVRAVLPSGKSSVKAVSVVWINHNAHDFDVALDALEKEYFKYSKKLLVSCLVEPKWNGKKSEAPRMDQNDEINEAVPNFNPGTMAVLSGPRRFADKAKIYLISRGYPEDCICVLP